MKVLASAWSNWQWPWLAVFWEAFVRVVSFPHTSFKFIYVKSSSIVHVFLITIQNRNVSRHPTDFSFVLKESCSLWVSAILIGSDGQSNLAPLYLSEYLMKSQLRVLLLLFWVINQPWPLPDPSMEMCSTWFPFSLPWTIGLDSPTSVNSWSIPPFHFLLTL